MTKIKAIALITLVIASVAASFLIHAKAGSALKEKAALFEDQSRQLSALRTEQKRLSNLAAASAVVSIKDHTAELAKLRAEAEALRKQTNQLANEMKPRLAQSPANTAGQPQTYSPEYNEQMNQLRGTKGTEARDIAYAMSQYAQDHHNQYPTSLDQITPYLAKLHYKLSGTNQFEIVFQGSSDQVQGIPWSSVAVVRETQPWLSPDGRPFRVYGMMGGSGQTVASDDNFQSWEAEHVIFPPKAP